MSTIGQRERATQQRLIQFFVKDLGYRYLGRSAGYAGDSNIDTDILSAWLKRREVSDTLTTSMDYLRFASTESGFRLLLTSIRHQKYLCPNG